MFLIFEYNKLGKIKDQILCQPMKANIKKTLRKFIIAKLSFYDLTHFFCVTQNISPEILFNF